MTFHSRLSFILYFAVILNLCYGLNITLKYDKLSYANANQEGFFISSGNNILYTSPVFQSNTRRNYTASLELLHKGIYTITLFSRNNRSWYEGSCITFFGQYDDQLITVHKEFSNSASFIIYLDYVIEQNSYWDIWSAGEQPRTIQIGNYTLTPARTLYLRKANFSFHNSIAYRLTALYRFGIIIYFQGKEIMRDNLPSGLIDNSTYAQGGYAMYSTKSFIRQTPLFKKTDSIDLLVELHWIKDDVEFGRTIQVLFDMRLNELGNSPDSSCYFLLHDPWMDEATDIDTLSFIKYAYSPATYSLSLPSMTTVNSFCFYASSYQWYQPQTFEIFLHGSRPHLPRSEGSIYSNSNPSPNTQSKVKVVGELYPEWSMKTWTCFQTVNNEFSANAVEIVMSSNHLPIHLYEIAVGICPQTNYPPLAYDDTKQYFVGIDVIELSPIHSIYSNCYLLSPLPEGLRLVNTTCRIDGIYSGSESDLILSIGATTPIQATTTLHLQIIQCTDLHIQVVREYGDTDFFFEWVYFEDIETDETLFSIPTQSSQQSSTQMVYNICLQPGVIRINLGNDKGTTWSTNSYLHVNLVSHAKLLPLLTTRYDEGIVGYEGKQLLSLVFPVLPGCLWYYHFDTIPKGWTDEHFTPIGWSTARFGDFPSSATQFQFYYIPFELLDITDYAGVRLHLYMEYCYVIYLNGLLVDAHGVSTELTSQTYCYNSHFGKFTTFTLASEKHLNEGENSLVVALVINQQGVNISTFDGFIQLIYSEQYSRLDDVTIIPISSSPNMTHTQQAIPNAEILFDLNSRTSVTITKCEQNQISFMLSETHSSRLETFNEIIFLNSVKEENIPDLGGFILEGRNSKLDDWTLITSVSDLYWMSHGQARRIFIHPPVSFRYYQFTNLTSEKYPNSCLWSLTAITFLLFEPDLNVPLEYPSTQVPALSLVYLYPLSPYYTSFEAQGLPSMFRVDPIFGIVYGIATEETHLNFQITAQNSKNVIVSHFYSFWLQSCLFPDSIPIELHVSPHTSLFTLTASVHHEGSTIASDTFIITNRDQYYRQYCLSNNQYYIFMLQATGTMSDNDKVWLTIYPFHLPLFPAFLDELGLYYATVDLSVRIGELLQWTYMIEWKSLEWMNDSFDDSHWPETTLTKPFIHNNILYFRNKLTITDRDVLLHLYLAYEGGVAIFLNGTLVSLLNLPTPYHNTSIAIEHHKFDQQEEITINLVQAGVYPGEHTLAIAYHHYPGQASASSRIVVIAFVVKEPTPLYRTSLIYEMGKSQSQQNLHPSNSSSHTGILTESTTLVIYNDHNSYLQLQPIDMLPIRPRGFRFHITPEVQLQVQLEGFRDGAWDTIVTMITSKEEVEISSEQLLIGYSYFRLKLLSSYPVPVFYISNFAFTFPSEAGPRCDADQEYLPAWNASISAAPCANGYTGYQYRECKISTFGPVILDHCLLNEPRDLKYSVVAEEYIVNVDQIVLQPIQYVGVVDYFTIEPALPPGLTFNQTTGVLRGIITKKIPSTKFIITAHNRVGITTVTFALTTRSVYCDANNGWPMRIVQNSSHILSCNEENNRKQIGLRYRRCWIKNGEGVWDEEAVYCFPQSAVALGIVIPVILLSLCYSECSHYYTVFKRCRLNAKK